MRWLKGWGQYINRDVAYLIGGLGGAAVAVVSTLTGASPLVPIIATACSAFSLNTFVIDGLLKLRRATRTFEDDFIEAYREDEVSLTAMQDKVGRFGVANHLSTTGIIMSALAGFGVATFSVVKDLALHKEYPDYKDHPEWSSIKITVPVAIFTASATLVGFIFLTVIGNRLGALEKERTRMRVVGGDLESATERTHLLAAQPPVTTVSADLVAASSHPSGNLPHFVPRTRL